MDVLPVDYMATVEYVDLIEFLWEMNAGSKKDICAALRSHECCYNYFTKKNCENSIKDSSVECESKVFEKIVELMTKNKIPKKFMAWGDLRFYYSNE